MRMVRLPRIPVPRRWTRLFIPSSVRGRIIAGFGLLIILLASVTVGSILLDKRHHSAEVDTERHLATAFLLQDARYDATLANLLLERYITTGNDAAVPVIRSSTATAMDNLAQATAQEEERGTEDEEELGTLDEAAAGAAVFAESAERMIALSQRGDVEGAAAALEEAAPVITQFQEVLGEAAEHEREEAVELRGQSDRTSSLAFWFTVVAGVISAGLGLVAAVFIARSVLRPLSSLETTALAVADGDLKARAPVAGPRELARVGTALNHMIDSLDEDIKREQETTRHLAYHDALTGLPNRALFQDRLTLALAQARRNKHMGAVMFLDLDRFKVVNDSAGHTEGDRLLRSVAGQLNELVREGDSVARIGGDEFTLLLPAITGEQDAVAIAERIIEAFQQPRVLGRHELRITASIGITIYPRDGEDAETLLQNADIAMYRAKDEGRSNFQMYTPAMNTLLQERLEAEIDLRHALERDQFLLHYQPQIDMKTGETVGMEALVRWQRPERGLVPPMEFIPLAEETGLIVRLGEWVLRTACAQNKAWQDAGLQPVRMAVNLSGRQFEQPDLVETVAQVLRETGLDREYLQLEITESTAMRNVDYTARMLQELKEMGVLIAIDDFGTGHSSLAYLKRFPVDLLKIDRTFIRGLPDDQRDAALANSIIAMAHGLKLDVIAEGVETDEQAAALREWGCDEAQGFLFSRPAPAPQSEKMLRQAKRAPTRAWNRSPTKAGTADER